jgi:hypothetical protein
MKDILKSKIVEICSVIVAMCALFIAVYQADSTNYHNRLAVLPMLQIKTDVYRGSSEIYLAIENSGNGPAILTEIESNNDPMLSLDSIVETYEKTNKLGFSNLGIKYLQVSPRSIIKPGETMKLASLKIKNNDNPNELIFKNLISSLPINVCYRSLYGDLLYVTSHPDSISDDSCFYDNATKIFGKWVRLKWPWEQQIDQKEIMGY